jgi:hypothetical protein
MNQTPAVQSSADDSKAPRLKGLRPTRLQDPLVQNGATISGLPIFV